MSDKQLILQTVEEMPQNATFSEIIDDLNLLRSVLIGLEETRNHQIVPHGEVAAYVQRWLEKSE